MHKLIRMLILGVFLIFSIACISEKRTINSRKGQAFICITPERKNGELNSSQKLFHSVTLKSGDITVDFSIKEDNCYYFEGLPAAKVFAPFSVENYSISEHQFKWQDGYISRGVYGKFDPIKTTKVEIVANQKVNLGFYKLIVEYDENNEEFYTKVSQGASVKKGATVRASRVIENSKYEIIKLER